MQIELTGHHIEVTDSLKRLCNRKNGATGTPLRQGQ